MNTIVEIRDNNFIVKGPSIRTRKNNAFDNATMEQLDKIISQQKIQIDQFNKYLDAGCLEKIKSIGLFNLTLPTITVYNLIEIFNRHINDFNSYYTVCERSRESQQRSCYALQSPVEIEGCRSMETNLTCYEKWKDEDCGLYPEWQCQSFLQFGSNKQFLFITGITVVLGLRTLAKIAEYDLKYNNTIENSRSITQKKFDYLMLGINDVSSSVYTLGLCVVNLVSRQTHEIGAYIPRTYIQAAVAVTFAIRGSIRILESSPYIAKTITDFSFQMLKKTGIKVLSIFFGKNKNE